MLADAEELLDTVQQLADWLSDVLVGGKDVSESLRVHDSDQHGEIDPPVDAMDRSDSLALLLKNAINLISTVLNGTEAQVSFHHLCLGIHTGWSGPAGHCSA